MSAVKSPTLSQKNEVDAVKTDAEKLLAQQEAQATYKAKSDKQTLEYVSACQALRKQGSELSFAVIATLASLVGSGSKVGRPSLGDFHAFTSALAERPLSHAQGEELCRIANKSVPKCKDGSEGKPVAVITAKRSDARGAQSWKFNAPAMTKDFVL